MKIDESIVKDIIWKKVHVLQQWQVDAIVCAMKEEQKKKDFGKGSDLLHEDRYGDRWRNSWRYL